MKVTATPSALKLIEDLKKSHGKELPFIVCLEKCKTRIALKSVIKIVTIV